MRAGRGQCEVRRQQGSRGSKSFIRKPRALSAPALSIEQHTSKSGCRLKCWLPLKPMANIPLASMGAALHARSRASHSSAVAMRAASLPRLCLQLEPPAAGEWLSLQPEKYQWVMKDLFLTAMVTALMNNSYGALWSHFFLS